MPIVDVSWFQLLNLFDQISKSNFFATAVMSVCVYETIPMKVVVMIVFRPSSA
jgi:hypothetical protein